MNNEDTIKDITEEVEEVEEMDIETEEEEDEVQVSGGILLLRTEEGGIMYEQFKEVTWSDITMFSEYLERLKDQVWESRMGESSSED